MEQMETGIFPRSGGGLVTLDELAGQMRFYADGSRNDYLHMCINLLQCGRVMTEAKERVPHGEWERWVEENSGFSFRNAQNYMQAYQTFGLNPDIARLGVTKMIRLLPVPEDIREKVMAENDAAGMSTREFEKAIREAKEQAALEARATAWAEAGEKMAEERGRIEAEAQTQIEQARAETQQEITRARTDARAETEKAKAEAEKAHRLAETTREQAEAMAERAREEARAEAEERIAEATERAAQAEHRAMLAENRQPEIPEGMKRELEEARNRAEQREQEIARLAETGRESLEETRRLTAENSRLLAEIREQKDMLKEQQEEIERTQAELLNMQSAQARGEDHVYTDELTLDVFGAAVREFIGICARMPHMGSTFVKMDNATLNQYFQLLKTVEDWTDGARRAIESVTGGVVIG